MHFNMRFPYVKRKDILQDMTRQVIREELSEYFRYGGQGLLAGLLKFGTQLVITPRSVNK